MQYVCALYVLPICHLSLSLFTIAFYETVSLGEKMLAKKMASVCVRTTLLITVAAQCRWWRQLSRQNGSAVWRAVAARRLSDSARRKAANREDETSPSPCLLSCTKPIAQVLTWDKLISWLNELKKFILCLSGIFSYSFFLSPFSPSTLTHTQEQSPSVSLSSALFLFVVIFMFIYYIYLSIICLTRLYTKAIASAAAVAVAQCLYEAALSIP